MNIAYGDPKVKIVSWYCACGQEARIVTERAENGQRSHMCSVCGKPPTPRADLFAPLRPLPARDMALRQHLFGATASHHPVEADYTGLFHYIDLLPTRAWAAVGLLRAAAKSVESLSSKQMAELAIRIEKQYSVTCRCGNPLASDGRPCECGG